MRGRGAGRERCAPRPSGAGSAENEAPTLARCRSGRACGGSGYCQSRPPQPLCSPSCPAKWAKPAMRQAPPCSRAGKCSSPGATTKKGAFSRPPRCSTRPTGTFKALTPQLTVERDEPATSVAPGRPRARSPVARRKPGGKFHVLKTRRTVRPRGGHVRTAEPPKSHTAVPARAVALPAERAGADRRRLRRKAANTRRRRNSYDPATHTFKAIAGEMTVGRGSAGAGLLPDGRVLIAGGYNKTEEELQSAELFNPETGDVRSSTTLRLTGKATRNPGHVDARQRQRAHHRRLQLGD